MTPRVDVLSLGGTIAMTPAAEGGVTPQLTAADLVAAVPALSALADVEAATVRTVPGASLGFADLLALVAEARVRVDAGAQGVVVTQGTDSLEETAYALDLLWDRDAPLVVTGAMRHPAAAGADGPGNLLAAVVTAAAAAAEGRGVLVAFADELHAARAVAKVHTTRPAAFASPGAGPVGTVTEGRVAFFARPRPRVAALPAPPSEMTPPAPPPSEGSPPAPAPSEGSPPAPPPSEESPAAPTPSEESPPAPPPSEGPLPAPTPSEGSPPAPLPSPGPLPAPTPSEAPPSVPEVALVTGVLGDRGATLRAAISAGVDGVVLAAMGAGHVPALLLPALEEAVAAVPVVAASRAGAGRLLRDTYAFAGSEADLWRLGVLDAGDLAPLQARVLLTLALWASPDRRAAEARFAEHAAV